MGADRKQAINYRWPNRWPCEKASLYWCDRKVATWKGLVCFMYFFGTCTHVHVYIGSSSVIRNLDIEGQGVVHGVQFTYIHLWPSVIRRPCVTGQGG